MSINLLVPGFYSELIDQSQIQEVVTDTSTDPVFMMAFSSDKGDEQMQIIKGDKFYKKFGRNISFKKHGQPLLQAANIINNGGTLVAKRVVAEDATLANLAIVAKVTKESVQKKNSDGDPLYTDAITSLETTTADGNTPIMVDSAKIVYECKSVENVKSMAEVCTEIRKIYAESGSENVYPLFVITDIGRGASNKRIRISPNYQESRYTDYVKYNFIVIENNTVLETIPFSFNPDIIDNNLNISLQSAIRYNSLQVDCTIFEDYTIEFVEKLSELSKTYSANELMGQDVLFGKTVKSVDLENITVDLTNGFNLSHAVGIDLDGGTNGAFGEIPFKTEAYKEQLVKFFGGELTDEVYDQDNFKFDLIIDANYPQEVKRKIESLVTFRTDACYLRDCGLNLKSLNNILLSDINSEKNIFCCTYHNSYDILDPFTKKQITVTIGYSLARLMIEHFKAGRNRPVAGELHDMTIPEAIEGTVNFLPKVTPSYNQKETLVDNRINYASYVDGVLTLETFFTSQENLTDFSFLNNVLAIQEVVKAVRTKCPKIRYSFMDGEDGSKYKEDVEAVLNKYIGNFNALNLVYLQDDPLTTQMASNKVFYAAIKAKFRKFNQAEYFKIYAINSEGSVE